MSHELILGGKVFTVSEPCFRDLRIILAALIQLNTQPLDKDVPFLLQSIMTALLGECHVTKFRRYRWEAWKIPAPTPDELQTLLNQIPIICNLTTSKQANNSYSNTDNPFDWDAIYWRISRVTGWTFSQIDTEMTLSRLSALSQHLLEKPLTDDLVAAYLGYEYHKPRTIQDAIDEMLMNNGVDNGSNQRH